MTALDVNLTIGENDDSSDFKLLPEGIYPFAVKSYEIAYYNGNKSGSIGACPQINLELAVGTGINSTDYTEKLILDSSLLWKIASFFVSIGLRKRGERFEVDWDATVGRGGWLELKVREYIKNKGERAGEKGYANDIARFLKPDDAAIPADGEPVIAAAKEESGGDDDGEW
jgi:hypothetical protein